MNKKDEEMWIKSNEAKVLTHLANAKRHIVIANHIARDAKLTSKKLKCRIDHVLRESYMSIGSIFISMQSECVPVDMILFKKYYNSKSYIEFWDKAKGINTGTRHDASSG